MKMKNGMTLLMMSAVLLISAVSHASQYDCKLSDGTPNDSRATTYTFDTDKEANKFVDLGSNTAVGCVTLKTQFQQLMTCGLGSDGIFSIFATADIGTSVLGVQSDSSGNKAVLTCVKKN
jgi:hypothetical protein